jgi:V-type H+-transporting ATPase proteolipid subunit
MGGPHALSFAAGCEPIAPLFSYLGIGAALAFTAFGSAFGTFKSSGGLFAVCSVHPDLIYRGLMPVIMAGIVGIYGLVAAIIIAPGINYPYSVFTGYATLAGGLSVGFTGLASGVTIGISGDVAVRAMAEQPRLLMGAMLILIFGEVLGLYGFIVSILLSSKKPATPCST